MDTWRKNWYIQVQLFSLNATLFFLLKDRSWMFRFFVANIFLNQELIPMDSSDARY